MTTQTQHRGDYGRAGMNAHIHDAEGRDIGFVCTGVNQRYVVRTHYPGNKKYNVRSSHRSYKAAVLAMAKEFATGLYNRADVLMTADYYEPMQICELVRR